MKFQSRTKVLIWRVRAPDRKFGRAKMEKWKMVSWIIDNVHSLFPPPSSATGVRSPGFVSATPTDKITLTRNPFFFYCPLSSRTGEISICFGLSMETRQSSHVLVLPPPSTPPWGGGKNNIYFFLATKEKLSERFPSAFHPVDFLIFHFFSTVVCRRFAGIPRGTPTKIRDLLSSPDQVPGNRN